LEAHSILLFIGELTKLDASDGSFTAKFTVLGDRIKHHVKEEEGEMFPKAQKANLDWEAPNAEVHKRKGQLTAKLTARS
jgi:hypothetical protein